MVRKEKKRKDYAFPRQFIEKPSILPGCPVSVHGYWYDLSASEAESALVAGKCRCSGLHVQQLTQCLLYRM